MTSERLSFHPGSRHDRDCLVEAKNRLSELIARVEAGEDS